MDEQTPLGGRTIMEFARPGGSDVTARAIALAGRIAADFGATVIKVEPPGGDPLRRAGPFVVGADGRRDSATFVFLNGGKRSLRLPEGEPGQLLLSALACKVAAVLTDDSDAVGAALAAAPIKILVEHGLPVCAAVPDERVADATILAASGLLDLIGEPAMPVALGGHQASSVTGLAAFAGLAAALAADQPGAAGETVRVSALETNLWVNWKSFAERLYTGRCPTRQGRLAEWQTVACRDGHATLIFLDRDWPSVVRLIGEDRLGRPPFATRESRRANIAQLYDIVRPWFAMRTRQEIYQLAKAQGLPIGPVLAIRELLDDPQLAAQRFFARPATHDGGDTWRVPTLPTVWNGRRFAPAVQSEPHGAKRNAGTDARHGTAAPGFRCTPSGPQVCPGKQRGAGGGLMSRYPLAGCRVLDLGIITAGASTSALLGDLGADVIKVEALGYLDPFRAWERALGADDWWNRSRFFDFTNRNKRGLALDLKRREGRDLFLDLVAGADVVVENFRRGVLDRLGLGYETLLERNANIILASVTSQGESGPDAGAASYGSTLEATSGLADLTRDADGRPLISGILLNYPDQIVSIYAAGVIVLAVMEQRRTGRGARLDIPQRELASFLLGEHFLAASAGSVAPPSGCPEPATALLASDDGRWLLCHGASREALAQAIAEVAPRGRPTPAATALVELFARRDVQAIVMRNGDDMLDAVRRAEIELAFARAPDGSDVKGMPFGLGGAPLTVALRAPRLGEHNAEILHELLGLDEAAIAALEAAGIVGTVPKV